MWTSRGVFCEPGPHRKHTGCSFLLHVYAELYMCGNFFSPFVAHLFKLSSGLLQRSPSAAPALHISCLSSARFLSPFFLLLLKSRVMHACARVHYHVCSTDILWFVPSDKRDSVENACVCVRARHAPQGNICLCAVPSTSRGFGSTHLSRTSAESPRVLKWQQHTDRATQ